MRHLAAAGGFHLIDLLHPLRYWGYQFWSGIGSDLGEITLLGVVIAAWRKINCQTPWCWRIGHHQTADGLHHLCHKHHPDLPNHKLSLGEIHKRHHDAKDNALVSVQPSKL